MVLITKKYSYSDSLSYLFIFSLNLRTMLHETLENAECGIFIASILLLRND